MQRNHAVDGLRGIFLVLMTYYHLLFFPFSHWHRIGENTYDPLGYGSGAEGFFLLSGLVCAWSYQSSREKHGDQSASARVYARVRGIYKWHLISFAFVVALCLLLPRQAAVWASRPSLASLVDHPVLSLLLAPFFLAMPVTLDVLPLYFVFIGVVPTILRAFYRNQGHRVLLFSLGLWAVSAAQLWFGAFAYLTKAFPSIPFSPSFYDPMALQIVFVAGLFLGFHSRNQTMPAPMRSRWLLPAAVAISVVGLLDRHWLHVSQQYLPVTWTYPAFVGIVRLLNFAALAVVFAEIVRRNPAVFCWRPFVVLGRSSLYVFVWQVVLDYILAFGRGTFESLHVLANVGLLLLALCSLWFPVLLLRTAASFGHDHLITRGKATGSPLATT